MKRIILKLSTLCLSLFLFAEMKGQDPQFSQFYNNSIYYNPATIGILYYNPISLNESEYFPPAIGISYDDPSISGISSNLRITSSYRNQWNSIPGGFSNYVISIDYLLLKKLKKGVETKKNIGIGFLMLNDNKGINQTKRQRFEVLYSYRIKLNDDQMLQFGMTLFSLNVRALQNSNFIFSDQLDPIEGVVQPSSFVHDNIESKIYPDWNIGMVYRRSFTDKHKYFFMPTIGASVSHIFRPNISIFDEEELLPIKYVAHSSFLTKIQGNFISNRKYALLNPGFIFEYQSPFQTFTMGTDFDMYPIRLGIWFRNKNIISEALKYNSVIFHAGIYLPVAFQSLVIDYTYDSTVSELEFASGGTHEISLKYNIAWSKCQ